MNSWRLKQECWTRFRDWAPIENVLLHMDEDVAFPFESADVWKHPRHLDDDVGTPSELGDLWKT